MKIILYFLIALAAGAAGFEIAACVLSALMERVIPDCLVRRRRASKKDDFFLWWDDNEAHNREALQHPDYEFHLVEENPEGSASAYAAYDLNGNLVIPPKNL